MGQTRLIGMLAALLLAACDAPGGTDDAAMPEGYSLYPGAEVIDSTFIEAADGSGTIVVMRIADTPAQAIAHYRREAETAGITIMQNVSSNGARVIAGEGSGGSTFSVNATPDGDATIVQLVVGQGL